jgi:hypothetical protein
MRIHGLKAALPTHTRARGKGATQLKIIIIIMIMMIIILRLTSAQRNCRSSAVGCVKILSGSQLSCLSLLIASCL